MNRKTVERLIVVAALLAAPVPSIFAEPSATTAESKQPADARQAAPARPRRERAVERFQAIAEELNLSAEQKSQIAAVLTDAREKFRALADEAANMGPRDRAERVREFMQDVRSQISSNLDEAQKAAFDEKMEAARARLQDRRENSPRADRAAARDRAGREGRATPVLDRLHDAMNQLDLSNDQREQAAKLLDELKTKIEQIRADAAGDRDAMRQQLRDAANSARQSFRQLLDDEQREKLKALMRGTKKESAGPTTAPSR